MAKSVLYAAVATALTLSACDSSPQPDPNAAEKATADTARQQELEAFRARANALNDPAEVLQLLRGKERFSGEFNIVNERLYTLVKPRIEAARTLAELHDLKQYALPGSTLVVNYMQRESELTRQQ